MDSCHPTQKMIKAKVYGVKGIPVYVRTIASRLRTNITGAIDIRTRRMVTMISKTVDKKCVKEFLKRIRERYENQGMSFSRVKLAPRLARSATGGSRSISI